MKKDVTIFLRHIIESIDYIEDYTKGLTEKDFLKSVEKQDSVIRRLEIPGEAVKNLPAEFKERYPYVEWYKAMATRNILIHHYFGIELDIVWDTVTKSLPAFKKQVKEILSKS